MAATYQSVQILGNVGQSPEMKQTTSGILVANLSVATASRYIDKTGNPVEHTEWHRVVAYDRKAEILRDYAAKGAKIYIVGTLHTDSWEDKESGEKRYRTKIVVNHITLLGPKGSGAARPDASEPAAAAMPQPATSDGLPNPEITADDIPF